MSLFTLTPIGILHTPFREPGGAPIQPAFAGEAPGTAELLPEYAAGLADLAGFERIWLMYWFDRAPPARLRVTPFRDTVERGLFATRAPCRPNAIGLSCVRVRSIEDRVVQVTGMDMLDKTPLLDIKPYVSAFDAYPDSRAGWLAQASESRIRADERFRGPS